MNIIRNWQDCDLYALQRLYAEMELPTTVSVDAILKLYQNADPLRFIYKAICHLNHVCGLIQAEKTTENHVEIGYWIRSAYRNQHILSTIIEPFCELVVVQLHVNHLYARVEASNTTSRHILLQHHFYENYAYQSDVKVYQRICVCKKNESIS